MGEVTRLLSAAREGDRAAADRAFALVYADLRQLARRQVRSAAAGPGATSLVHEVWMRMVRSEAVTPSNREHLLRLASRAMRQLVIDHARSRATGKRGGGAPEQALDDIAELVGKQGDAERLLELDGALARLESVDPQLVALVEMRFFGGIELEEIAQMTGRSERSLKRDWRKARAILHAQLGEAQADE